MGINDIFDLASRGVVHELFGARRVLLRHARLEAHLEVLAWCNALVLFLIDAARILALLDLPEELLVVDG